MGLNCKPKRVFSAIARGKDTSLGLEIRCLFRSARRVASRVGVRAAAERSEGCGMQGTLFANVGERERERKREGGPSAGQGAAVHNEVSVPEQNCF